MKDPTRTSLMVHALVMELRSNGVPAPETEHRFHPERKWRFDLAWPELMLAVEIDGGLWIGGRHVQPIGYERDCEKLNEAIVMGWRVLRFTPGMVESGNAASTIERAYRRPMRGDKRR